MNEVPEVSVTDADGNEVLRWLGGRWVGELANRAEIIRRTQADINSAGAVAWACLHVAESIGGTASPEVHRLVGA